MRLTILIALLECLSSLVLAVTLYGITRDEDHELATLGLVCRVAEGVLGSVNNIPSYLGLLWLAKARVGTGVPDIPTMNALRRTRFRRPAHPRISLWRGKSEATQTASSSASQVWRHL